MLTFGQFSLLFLAALYFGDVLYNLGAKRPGWDVLVVFALLGVYFTENVLSHGPLKTGDVVMAVLYVAAAWSRFDLAKYRAEQKRTQTLDACCPIRVEK